jgi:hypothetical protein
MNANIPPVSAVFVVLVAIVLAVAITNARAGHRHSTVDAVQICSVTAASNCVPFRFRP